jgi:hypothetical protein
MVDFLIYETISEDETQRIEVVLAYAPACLSNGLILLH